MTSLRPISIPCPTSKIFQASYISHGSFPKSARSGVITRFRWPGRTSNKTAVITPHGIYEFLQTPFGLKNAAQAFQHLMNSVCQGLNFMFMYLDDMLVVNRTDEEHWSHLAALFDRLKAHGLVLNLAECVCTART